MASALSQDPPRTVDGSELKVKVTQLDHEHVSFILDGTNLGCVLSSFSCCSAETTDGLRLANALRRTMISDIATLGKQYLLLFSRAQRLSSNV
jgi:hypothetical protein